LNAQGFDRFDIWWGYFSVSADCGTDNSCSAITTWTGLPLQRPKE
jgi:hypothetical protein